MDNINTFLCPAPSRIPIHSLDMYMINSLCDIDMLGGVHVIMDNIVDDLHSRDQAGDIDHIKRL